MTVSPGYAQEIKLQPLLTVVRDAQRVQKPVLGIMNGIDTATWSPSTDPYLLPALRYSDEQAGPSKVLAKLQLQVCGWLVECVVNPHAVCGHACVRCAFVTNTMIGALCSVLRTGQRTGQ